MRWTPQARGVWARALAMLALAWLLAGAVAGCAAPGSRADDQDMPTASDDSDARRRARIRMELAVGYFEQGKPEIALDEVKQVLAIDPTFGDAWNLRGLIYMRLGDNHLAEDSFKRAVAINPRDGNAQHNLGWLLCQGSRYPEAQRAFEAAMASPLYPGRAKTLMAEGLCEARAGKPEQAERTLMRSYELDAGNPVTGYNLALLLVRRGELERARFYIRRLNNSELANAESLWLGIRVERRLNDPVAMRQLGEQLRKRFPGSREAQAYDRGAYDE
ncbi:type IV pilus biogenesis/stability protein PilW [Ramlibacter aquaticus]|uniref:Type IV pilus biogenesis/stability protein PilW n=2 Tax=Ramlibacter TaxID=174951 RepID=A0ABR9SD08_9BURK|nr:type IV pilus biogenesis/stability protein PilW [Ramlibacter aquaticus]